MAESKELVVSESLLKIRSYMKDNSIKERFNSILGERSGAYMASIINVIGGSDKLQKCDSQSIMNASFIAATLDLPIDPNLGFAAIVPYGGKAQFQMMTKGFIQLAIRSGQYAEMNVSNVYADEIKSYNPITQEIIFNDFALCRDREDGKESKVVGYYAYFNLVSGFRKSLYMTVGQIEKHGKRYSQTYKKGFGNWVDQKQAMHLKTVIKMLISKWGILSIQMQKGIEFDQAVITDEGTPEYPDNEKPKLNAASSLDDTVVDIESEEKTGEENENDKNGV